MKALALLALTLPVLQAQAPWYTPSGWTYRAAIRVPASRALAQTVLAVNVGAMSAVLAQSQPNCNDILFTLADGQTKIAHRWKGSPCTWALINKSALGGGSADSVVYLYTGNSGASDQSNPAGVWDAQYTNVYALQNGALTDDVGGHTCVLQQGTMKTEPSQLFPGTQAMYFDGKTYLRCPATLSGTYSIEAWFRGANINPENRLGVVYTVGNAGSLWGSAFVWDTGPQGRGWQFGGNNNPLPIAPAYDGRRATDYLKADRYNHIMATDNGTTLTGVWNGTVSGLLPSGFISSNGFLYIGSNYYFTTAPDCSTGGCFQGWIDEVRISNTPRAPSWESTQYTNVRYPDLFYTVGALEQNTSVAPMVNSFSAEINILTGESAKLQWFVSRAATLSIDHGLGSQSALVSGSVAVIPGSTTTYTLTATNGASTTTATFTVNVLATGLYLRSGPPADVGFCGYALSPFKLFVCAGEHTGFQVGDRISVWGLCTDDPAHYYFPNFGWRVKISAMTDAGTITGLTDLLGNPVTPNGAWKNCIGPNNQQTAYGGVVTLYPTPPSYASGGFDGLNGNIMRHIGISTDNGLTSLVCVSGTCTVTTSFPHDVRVNDKITVWGTTAASGNLNTALGSLAGATWVINDHTVTAVTTNTYQFTTTSPDGTYTTNNSCPPYANCVVVSQWFITANVAVSDMLKYINGYGNSPPVYKCAFDGGPQPCTLDLWGNNGRSSGIFNYLDRGNAPIKDSLIYMFTHLERINGNAWTMPENKLVNYEAGNRLVGFPEGVFYIPGTFTFPLGKQLLSSGEQATLRDKVFGDIWYANSSTPCNKARALLHPQPSEDIANGLAGCANAGAVCDTTHVALAASDSQPNGFYVGYAVQLHEENPGTTSSPYNERWGLITAYNATSKTATITTPGYPYNAWTFAATSATLYRIFPTVLWDNGSVVPGNSGYGMVTGNVTGLGTHFTTFSLGTTSPFLAADVLFTGSNSGGSTSPIFMEMGGAAQFIAITDDTHAQVMLNNYTWMNTTYRVPMFWSLGWRTGDCGARWAFEHQGWDTQDFQHPSTFLSSFGLASFPELTRINNNSPIGQVNEMAMDLGFAADDVRAAHDAESTQSPSHGWWMMGNMAMQGGMLSDGFGYNQQDLRNAADYTLALTKSIPTFPSLDTSGPWLKNQTYWRMYTMRPDNPGDGTVKYSYALGSSSNSGDPLNTQGSTDDYHYNQFSIYNPTDTTSRYYNSFVNTWVPPGSGFNDARIFASTDPRSFSTSYKNMTLQRALLGDSKPTCQALTGWDCWPNYQGGTVYSYGSASSGTARWDDRSATLLGVTASGGSQNMYQAVSGIALGIFKVGGFLGCDAGLPSQGPIQGVSLFELGYGVDGDVTKLCDSLDFGYANYNFTGSFNPDYISNKMDGWAKAGNSDGNAGDANSNYMYAHFDDKGSYGSRPNVCVREVVHLKEPGLEEIILDRRYCDISNSPAQTITEHMHYLQSGEAPSPGYYSFYQEGPPPTCPSTHAQCVTSHVLTSGTSSGSTIMVGMSSTSGVSVGDIVGLSTGITPSGFNGLSGPVTSIVPNTSVTFTAVGPPPGTLTWVSGGTFYDGMILDTASAIVSSEDGSGPDSAGPKRDKNLITKFVRDTGHPIQLRYDGQAWAEYWIPDIPGIPGYSILVVPHGHTERVSVCAGACGANAAVLNYIKVHKLTTQPDTTLTLSSPSAGSNWLTAQTTDSVSAFSADTTLQTSFTATTTHAGTARYLVAGLSPGTYVIAGGTGGVACNGTGIVAPSDNTCFFKSTAGTISITQGCSITTTTLPGGTVGVFYSTTLTTTGCTGSVTWTQTAGTMCTGLTLNAGGTITGTPTTGQTCSFTATATDSASHVANQPLSITITSGATLGVNCAPPTGPTTVGTPWTTTCTASNGSPTYTWSITLGSLPSGITGPSPSTGTSTTVAGTPTVGGAYSFSVTVTDALSATASFPFSGSITAPGSTASTGAARGTGAAGTTGH